MFLHYHCLELLVFLSLSPTLVWDLHIQHSHLGTPRRRETGQG